jgi:hypothetical protein
MGTLDSIKRELAELRKLARFSLTRALAYCDVNAAELVGMYDSGASIGELADYVLLTCGGLPS